MKWWWLRRHDDQRGQAVILVVVGMVAFLGFAALAIDVGSWYQEQRQLQSSVDASALAAAIDLPAVEGAGTCTTPATTPSCDAQTTALAFLTANVTGNPDTRSPTAPTATYPTPTGAGCTPSLCVAVDATRPTHGFLGGVINSALNTVTVHAHAQAYVGPPSTLKEVNSAAIDQAQFNAATGCPSACVLPRSNVTLNFDQPAPENFPLLDLNSASSTPTSGNTVNTSTMGQWIQTGDPAALPANAWYGANTGQKNGVKNSFCDDPSNEPNGCLHDYSNPALGLSGASIMILPVFNNYDTATGSYFVIGFAAFVIAKNGVTWNGNTHTLTGWLVKFVATGLPAGPGSPSFGVFAVGLDG